ncbi:MAG: RDD family protein [Acidimicrobiales bacterium]
MFRPLLRRIVAWIVDLVIIAVPSAVVALSQAERFVGNVTGDGSLRFGGAQTARLAELDGPLVVHWTQGRNLHVWAGSGLLITVVAVVCLAVIVLALVPANLEGATPGMRQVQLHITTVDGDPPTLGAHLARTAVGLVDLAPYVLPGLVGLGFALGPGGQRLGDRVAGTVVVDRRHPDLPRRSLPDRTTLGAPGPAFRSDGRRSPLGAPADVPVGWATAASRWAGDVGADLAPITASTIAATGRPAVDRRTVLPPVPRPLRRPSGRVPAASSPHPGTTTGSAPTPPSPGAGTRQAARPAPVWDDDLEAWVVTHPVTGARFRHEPTTGRWEPIDPGPGVRHAEWGSTS